MTPPKFTQHQLSANWPAIQDDEFRDLVESIKTHGLINPITIYDDEVLDGFQRYRACCEAGVTARTVEYTGNNPAGFVEAANLHRRHITKSQIALAVVAGREWAGRGKSKSEPGSYLQPIDNIDDSKWEPGSHLADSEAKVAKESGMSRKTIQQAKIVIARGTDEQKAAVKDGKLSVKKAAEQIAGKKPIPKREQAAAPAAPPEPTEPEYTPLDEARDTISELQDSLALANMGGAEKEKEQAAELIARLRAEIKTLAATLAAVTISRDTLQNENAALKRHNVSLQKKLK